MEQPAAPTLLDVQSSDAARSELEPKPNPRPERRLALRETPDALYRSLSDQERFAVASATGRCLEEFVTAGRAVYLDMLGVLFPVTATVRCSYPLEQKLAVRDERVTTLDFEKCGELLSLHRERFGNVVESRELAARLHPLLPLALQLRWSLDDVKYCVRGLLRAMRGEIVTNGVSRRLDRLGVFYALHNRHGATPDDWFAGADIFFSSSHRWVREAGKAQLFDRPVLSSSCELLSAAYGKACGTFAVNVPRELSSLGDFNTSKFPQLLQRLSVKVFRMHSDSARGAPVLLYCTDGLRRLTLGGERGPRCELTFQLALDSESADGAEIPVWPCKAFALAAAVIARQLRGEDSASLGAASALTEGARLRGVLLQRLARVAHEQLCDEGEFSYVNILGLCDDELAVAELHGDAHLVALLKRKGFDQVTKPNRRSAMAGTVHASPSGRPKILPRDGTTTLPRENTAARALQ